MTTEIDVNSMTPEQLISLARTKQAEQSLQHLRTKGISEFKTAVQKETTLEGLYKLVKSFAWHFEKNNRIINPTNGKRGRKSKK